MEKPIFSVSGLVGVVNQTLEFAYPTVVVEGEVASFKVNKNKFVFFDIKDDEAAVGCFMMVYALKIPLEDGMKIRIVAQPRLTAWGKFSLTVLQVLPVGEGSIKRAFELLKARLQSEGLFDSARKRPLPTIPARVGVITSAESAGYADFLKITNQRWGGLQIEVANVQVQGMGAAEQIVRAIEFFNQQAALVDVLVIIRGGGSAEDLAVFNDEALTRSIASSRIPTLVGVGHETDTSLCDLAADVRAATPSNAAQILVPDREAIISDTDHKLQRLLQHIQTEVEKRNKVVNNTTKHMLQHVERLRENVARNLAQADRLLKQLDPKAVLHRGYALVRTANGALVKGEAANVAAGDTLTITTQSAIITTGVTNVTKP